MVEVTNHFETFINFHISRLDILFGSYAQPFDSAENLIILHSKRCIWASCTKVCHTLVHTRDQFHDQWARVVQHLADQDQGQDDEHHGPNPAESAVVATKC